MTNRRSQKTPSETFGKFRPLASGFGNPIRGKYSLFLGYFFKPALTGYSTGNPDLNRGWILCPGARTAFHLPQHGSSPALASSHSHHLLFFVDISMGKGIPLPAYYSTTFSTVVKSPPHVKVKNQRLKIKSVYLSLRVPMQSGRGNLRDCVVASLLAMTGSDIARLWRLSWFFTCHPPKGDRFLNLFVI